MLIRNSHDIGEIVRTRRTAQNMSQGELADIIGTSRKWVSDLENGHDSARIGLVIKALNAVGARIDATDDDALDEYTHLVRHR